MDTKIKIYKIVKDTAPRTGYSRFEPANDNLTYLSEDELYYSNKENAVSKVNELNVALRCIKCTSFWFDIVEIEVNP